MIRFNDLDACALCTPTAWHWRVRRGPVCAPVLGRCWWPRPEVWR